MTFLIMVKIYIVFGICTYPLQHKSTHSGNVEKRKTATLFLEFYCTQINRTDMISSELDVCVRVRVYVWPRREKCKDGIKSRSRNTLDSNRELYECYECVGDGEHVCVFTSERHTDKMRRNGENISCQNRANHTKPKDKKNRNEKWRIAQK